MITTGFTRMLFPANSVPATPAESGTAKSPGGGTVLKDCLKFGSRIAAPGTWLRAAVHGAAQFEHHRRRTRGVDPEKNSQGGRNAPIPRMRNR